MRTAADFVGDEPDLPARVDGESTRYLREVSQLLWPPRAEIMLGSGAPRWVHPFGAVRPGPAKSPDSEGSKFILIPSGNRPPLVVPAEPHLAGAAIRHLAARKTWPARLATKALSVGLASGLGGMVVRGRMHVTASEQAETIESYLSTAVARELRVSMYLGPARANRKPVLQLLSPAGDLLGFAKVGLNPLTRELVRAERAALIWLERAGLSRSRVPTVIHFGEWHGMEILVLSALPAWLPRTSAPVGRLAAAMVEVAHVGGLTNGPLATSSYLSLLAARLAEADEGPDRMELLKALDALKSRFGDTELTYGAWHGDWSPWNMANTHDGLLVWDWERFTCDVPLGFDALHHWLQTEIGPRRREPRAAAMECIDRAPQLTAPFGVNAAEARLTTALYMTDLATRYLVDRQARAGARLGDPGTWLIPSIVREATRLPLRTAG